MSWMVKLLAAGAALLIANGAELATAPPANAFGFIAGFPLALPIGLPVPLPVPPPPPPPLPVAVAPRIALVPPPIMAPPPPLPPLRPIYAGREVVYVTPRPVYGYRYNYRRVVLRESQHHIVHRVRHHRVHHVVYRKSCGCR